MEDGGVCCVVLDDYCYADLEYSCEIGRAGARRAQRETRTRSARASGGACFLFHYESLILLW